MIDSAFAAYYADKLYDGQQASAEAADAHAAALEFLSRYYGRHVVLTQPTLAPSIIWRSDREYYGSEQRFAWRCHAFTRLGDPLRTRMPDSLGLYLGFVHVRPDSQLDPTKRVCEAFLRPPERMQYPPYYITCLGHYSSYYSIQPFAFPCVPFVVADEQFGGVCAHACIYTATTVCPTGRSCGVCEMTALLMDSPEHGGGNDFIDEPFKLVGVAPKEIAWLLAQRHSSGIQVSITCNPNDERSRLQLRTEDEILRQLVEGYVRHGIPVIVSVDYGKLYGEQMTEEDRQRACARGMTDEEYNQHAIVLIGYKDESDDGPFEFIYHDSARGPYQAATSKELSKALLFRRTEQADHEPAATGDEPDDGWGHAQAVACCPKGTNLSPKGQMLISTVVREFQEADTGPGSVADVRWSWAPRAALASHLVRVATGPPVDRPSRLAQEQWAVRLDEDVAAHLVDLAEYAWVIDLLGDDGRLLATYAVPPRLAWPVSAQLDLAPWVAKANAGDSAVIMVPLGGQGGRVFMCGQLPADPGGPN